MKADLLVTNAKLVLEDGVKPGCLAVADGKILAAGISGNGVEANETLDAGGRYLLPGAIDTHPHFFQPGSTWREDLAHGTMAAASGGYTTILDMPNTIPPVRDEDTFLQKKREAEKSSLLDFALWGAAMPSNMERLAALHDLGCVAFKAFTLDTGPDFDYSDEYFQLRQMRVIRSFNGIYGAHAENGSIVKHMTRQLGEKAWSTAVHDMARPWEAELTAINTLLLYARLTGCKLHICHMSIPEGARLVEIARREGVDVTVETCMHYLTLNTKSAAPLGTFAMINPPLRSPERMEQMWEYVLNGTIDYLGTDHAPYLEEEKLPANGDLWQASPGAPGIDTAIPLLLEEGVKKRGMDWTRLSAFISTNAAKRFGLYPRKGVLKEGSDADFILADMDSPWIHTRANSFSKTKVTRFAHEGRRMECAVTATYVRGKPVFRDGKIIQAPGYGRFLRPYSLDD